MRGLAPLREDELRAALHARGQHRFAAALHFHAELGSTSTRARELAEAGAPDGTLVVADRQTAGRGRHGREWFSPPGRNLYATFVLRPDALPLSLAPALSLATAVALAQAIETLSGLRPALKWPNDVLLGTRKCAGILPELTGRGERAHYVLIGVGVNVNLEAAALPDELAGLATSLAIEARRTFSRGVLLAELCAFLDPWVARLQHEGVTPIAHAWRARAGHLGARVRFEGERGQRGEGIALALDDDGALLVRDAEGGIHRVLGGEVLVLDEVLNED